MPESKHNKIDSIFRITPPLLFAHRGGAGEVPESTKSAFFHAMKCGADVLELDVQLTADKKIVVWHGPNLDNVKIKGQSNSKIRRRLKRKRNIWDYNWDELQNNAWVAHPENEKNLKNIPGKSDRQLMLLKEFLDFVTNELDDDTKIPLNIELKGQKRPFLGKSMFLEKESNAETTILQRFKDTLDKKAQGRTIIVASTNETVLSEFDKLNVRDSPYPTNVSFNEQLNYAGLFNNLMVRFISRLFKAVLNTKRGDHLKKTRAFETSYALISKDFVGKIQREYAAIYVFLSGFWPSKGLVDKNKVGNQYNDREITSGLYKVLDTGVDGIMTDYPERIGRILKKWKQEHP